jgi:hypothetical protein
VVTESVAIALVPASSSVDGQIGGLTGVVVAYDEESGSVIDVAAGEA